MARRSTKQVPKPSNLEWLGRNAFGLEKERATLTANDMKVINIVYKLSSKERR